jgi:signal transduction histidine kinase
MTSGLFAAATHVCDPHFMRAIRVASFGVWLLVGLPVIVQGADSWRRMTQWAIAYVLFAILFASDRLALAAACVIVTVLLLCDGFEGALMVLIAMRLGARGNVRAGILWIVIQTFLLGAAIAIHWSLRPALLLAPPYLGFQLLAFFTVRFHAIAADRTRIAERLRIAQELHDALGHHLTALTLNLEAALQRTEGDAHRDVQQAQTLARQLLADVRSIVAEENEPFDLSRALQTIVGGVPQPHVHLDIDRDIRIDDPERAHIVLRCVQEIVTNAARHSGAENLWIVLERENGGFRIRAHDDGRGSTGSRDGFGLRGMRARLEGAGGQLRIDTQPGRGFDVVAVLPS